MTEHGKHQILVVDDDQIEVVLLRRHLDRAGLIYELTACHDPDQAVAMLAERTFTIVFLDHHLGRPASRSPAPRSSSTRCRRSMAIARC
jgi:PleD family two-component response regulator